MLRKTTDKISDHTPTHQVSSKEIISSTSKKSITVALKSLQEYQLLKDPNIKGIDKYNALLSLNNSDEKLPYIIPKRRSCVHGGMETEETLQRAKNTTFIKDEQISKIYPMRFLRNSPFVVKPSGFFLRSLHKKQPDDPQWKAIQKGVIDRLHAIAVTEDGRHVILQQAIKSCVPSCVAMLVLDHGHIPNYSAIKETNLANDEKALSWIEKAGLEPKITHLNSLANLKETLAELLKENGPGILSIYNPDISGHVIILDEISSANNTATIRDSFHGWSVTIDADLLLSWIELNDPFIQINKVSPK